MPTLTLAQARRVALAAQGFGRARDRPVGIRQVQAEIDRLAQLQIDTINVVERAHYLPLYSRLGPYDTALLDRCFSQPPRRLFEYWGHAASLIDVRLQPALRHRMAKAADEAWGRMQRMQREHPGLVERVYADVAAAPRGLTARQIEHDEERTRDHWGWNWSAVKTALEWLLWAGRITSARRNSQFERVYAIPERVLPAAVVQAPDLTPAEADLVLVRRAVRALGVGSVRCIADYFRMPAAATRDALTSMVATGEVEQVAVTGWTDTAYLDVIARRPRQVAGRALVSPFDSLVFERRRLEALFGVDYRIEIYVPEPQRRFGYYVYLFCLGEAIVARVDLKADRRAGVLRVQAAWREPSAAVDDDRVAAELAAELQTMASWLGLRSVDVTGRGDLAPALRRTHA